MAKKTTPSKRSSKKNEASEAPDTEAIVSDSPVEEASESSQEETPADTAASAEPENEASEEAPADTSAEGESTEPDDPRDPDEVMSDEDQATEVSEDLPDTDVTETAEGDGTDEALPEQSPAEAHEPEEPQQDETAIEEVTEPAPPARPPDQTAETKSGFLPLVIGGLVAGLIGFGAGSYLSLGGSAQDTGIIDALRAEVQSELDAQASTIGEIQAAQDSASVDLTPLEERLTALEAAVQAFAQLSERLDTAEAELAAQSDRLAGIERDGLAANLSDEAIASYETELKRLEEAMAAQRAEIEQMTADARALEASAQETAQATRVNAALSQIRTALDTGGGFSEALAELREAGIEPPEALRSVAADGTFTLSELQSSFPDAARAALAASRDAAAQAGETGGASAFLRNVLGARSLEPREGDDADAVLSRAEAALRENRLTDALAELGTLPEEAAAEMADWAASANQRLEAVSAAQALSEELN